MLTTTLVVALVFLAAATDLWRQQIYNWLTYGGALAALAINAAGSAIEQNASAADLAQVGQWHRWLGWIGLGESAAGWAACGFLMLVAFVFFQIGGGDVKLLAMIGAFLGLERGLETLLWTFVLGASAAVILLIWRVGAGTLLKRIGRQLMFLLRRGGWLPLSPEEKQELQPPLYLAPCAAAAVIIVRFGLIEKFT